jgi:hypothetical protein
MEKIKNVHNQSIKMLWQQKQQKIFIVFYVDSTDCSNVFSLFTNMSVTYIWNCWCPKRIPVHDTMTTTLFFSPDNIPISTLLFCFCLRAPRLESAPLYCLRAYLLEFFFFLPVRCAKHFNAKLDLWEKSVRVSYTAGDTYICVVESCVLIFCYLSS